jgi:hypothetical protein
MVMDRMMLYVIDVERENNGFIVRFTLPSLTVGARRIPNPASYAFFRIDRKDCLSLRYIFFYITIVFTP